ncbi:alpha/beta hydrolase [Rummeliibacillus sp. JY-2-4R]
MIKLIPPTPFYYKGDKRAVLLLHSFTSSTKDMKKLGKYLNSYGYSCYAPLYTGHGIEPELLLSSGPLKWWEDAVLGYTFLKDQGFDQIAVVGLSLGGEFALKVGQEYDVIGIVTMSVPKERKSSTLQKRILYYANRYKELEGKSKTQINEEINELLQQPSDSMVSFQQMIDKVMENLKRITSPIHILYGELDEPLYGQSANFIYHNVSSSEKVVKGYPNSTHLMTLGKDSDAINQDILNFLEELPWK